MIYGETWSSSAYEYRSRAEREMAEAVRSRDSETTEAIGQAGGAWYCPDSLEAIGRKVFGATMGEGEV